MFNIILFMYQAIGTVYALVIPTLILMLLLWIIIKAGKGFYKSITK